MPLNARFLVRIRRDADLRSAASIAACAHKPPPPAPVESTPPAQLCAAAPAISAGPAAGRPEPAPPRPRSPALPRTSSSTPATGSISTPTNTTYAPTASQTLDRQARMARAATPRVAVRVEGNCDDRGTREYNSRPWRPARGCGEGLSWSVPRRSIRVPDHHHLLRQGEAPGRRARARKSWSHDRNAHTALIARRVAIRFR